MPKVFPVQKTKFILDSASDYGVVQPPLMTDFTYPASKSKVDTDDRKNGYLENLAHRLQEFDPDKDFILLVGDPIFIGITFIEVLSVLIDKKAESFKVLRYDKNLERYLDIEVVV